MSPHSLHGAAPSQTYFFLFGFLWIILLEILISYKLLKSSPEWLQIQIQNCRALEKAPPVP